MGEESPLYSGGQAFGIELGLVERAAALNVYPLGERRYEITGWNEPHFVDLATDAAWPCDCGDFVWRGDLAGPCKHLLHARLDEGDSCVSLRSPPFCEPGLSTPCRWSAGFGLHRSASSQSRAPAWRSRLDFLFSAHAFMRAERADIASPRVGVGVGTAPRR
jgi:hypothetical protein